MDKWIEYTKLDLKFNLTRIDTRDFHGYNDDCSNKEMKVIFDKIKLKYRDDNEDSCYTEQEIKDYINKLYIESGGKANWRFLSFLDNKKCGWIYKYLNIYKLKENCYIIEGKQNDKAILLNKSTINKGINKKHL